VVALTLVNASGPARPAVSPPAPYPTFSMVAATSSASVDIVAASGQSAPYDQDLRSGYVRAIPRAPGTGQFAW
jgi:hypothetical protein